MHTEPGAEPGDTPVEHQKTTAEILRTAVDSFNERLGARLSLRTISVTFLNEEGESPLEACTLSRWTKPGGRRNWMIPTFRILTVAKALAGPGKKTELLNDLMMARIAELSNEGDAAKNEALVTATWLVGLLAPTADEAVLTKTFNRVFANYPHQVLNDKAFVAELTAFLDAKRAQLEGEMFAENELERAQVEVAGKSGATTRPRVTPTSRTDHSESAYYKLTKAQKNAGYSAKFQALQAIKRAKAARPF